MVAPKKILTISKYTFIYGLRDRFMWVLLVFFLCSIGLSKFLADISLVEQAITFKVSMLTFINLLTCGITIVYVTFSQRKEIYDNLTYLVLTKPIRPIDYVIGKILGNLGLLLLFLVIVAPFLLLFNVTSLKGGLYFLYLTFLEGSILISISVLFSLFISSATGALLSSAAFYLIAHSTKEVLELSEKFKNDFYILISKLLYYLLPSLDYYSCIEDIVYNSMHDIRFLSFVTLYTALYFTIITLVAYIDLEKKEF